MRCPESSVEKPAKKRRFRGIPCCALAGIAVFLEWAFGPFQKGDWRDLQNLRESSRVWAKAWREVDGQNERAEGQLLKFPAHGVVASQDTKAKSAQFGHSAVVNSGSPGRPLRKTFMVNPESILSSVRSSIDLFKQKSNKAITTLTLR